MSLARLTLTAIRPIAGLAEAAEAAGTVESLERWLTKRGWRKIEIATTLDAPDPDQLPLPVVAVEEGPDNQEKGDAGAVIGSAEADMPQGGHPHVAAEPAGAAGAGSASAPHVDDPVVGVPFPRKRSA